MYSSEIQQLKEILDGFFKSNSTTQPEIQFERSPDLKEGISIDQTIYIIPGHHDGFTWIVAEVNRTEEGGILVTPIDKTNSAIQAVNSAITIYFHLKLHNWIDKNRIKEERWIQ